MTQVSRYPVSKDVSARISDIFLKTITSLNTKNDLNLFFNEFLTPTEQIMLAKRLSIVFLLSKGYGYKSVSQVLHVSTSTVASVSIRYKNNALYRKYIDRIVKDEEIGQFLESLVEKIVGLVAFPSAKTRGWYELKREMERKRTKRSF